MNETPLPFKHQVFTRDRLRFSNDERLRLRLVDEVIRQYIDLKKLREIAQATQVTISRIEVKIE